jgi:hypothetical protein
MALERHDRNNSVQLLYGTTQTSAGRKRGKLQTAVTIINQNNNFRHYFLAQNVLYDSAFWHKTCYTILLFHTKPSQGNWIYCPFLMAALRKSRNTWHVWAKYLSSTVHLHQRTHHNEISLPYTQSLCLNFGLRNSSSVSSDLVSFRIFDLFVFWTSSKTNSVAHFSCLIISLPCPLHQSPPHNLLHIQFRNLCRNLAPL